MKFEEVKIKVADLAAGYVDDGDGGVYGYNGKLCIRPCYQREFVFSDKKRDEVIYNLAGKTPNL